MPVRDADVRGSGQTGLHATSALRHGCCNAADSNECSASTASGSMRTVTYHFLDNQQLPVLGLHLGDRAVARPQAS